MTALSRIYKKVLMLFLQNPTFEGKIKSKDGQTDIEIAESDSEDSDPYATDDEDEDAPPPPEELQAALVMEGGAKLSVPLAPRLLPAIGGSAFAPGASSVFEQMRCTNIPGLLADTFSSLAGLFGQEPDLFLSKESGFCRNLKNLMSGQFPLDLQAWLALADFLEQAAKNKAFSERMVDEGIVSYAVERLGKLEVVLSTKKRLEYVVDGAANAFTGPAKEEKVSEKAGRHVQECVATSAGAAPLLQR